MIKITNIKIYLLKYKNKNPVLSSFGNIKLFESVIFLGAFHLKSLIGGFAYGISSQSRTLPFLLPSTTPDEDSIL